MPNNIDIILSNSDVALTGWYRPGPEEEEEEAGPDPTEDCSSLEPGYDAPLFPW